MFQLPGALVVANAEPVTPDFLIWRGVRGRSLLGSPPHDICFFAPECPKVANLRSPLPLRTRMYASCNVLDLDTLNQ